MLRNLTHSSMALFWLPIMLLTAQLVAEKLVTGPMHDLLITENGPVETLQFLLLLGGFVAAGLLLRDLKCQPPLYLTLWGALAALGCFYVGGEEISWGQHFLNWGTPSYWAALNDQEETNLHNTSAWFDQKPRLLLEIGVIVGGLLLPFYHRVTKKNLPAWLARITPPARLWFVAFLVLVIKFADKVGGATEVYLFYRASEVIEFYLYYFILIYLIELRARVANIHES